jgi:hypothetical protein
MNVFQFLGCAVLAFWAGWKVIKRQYHAVVFVSLYLLIVLAHLIIEAING